MALVVLLRGVNVGGHRIFRPTALVEQLKHLDAVNIGAAGTFVVREPISPARLRAECARLLPFDTEIVICQGRDITKIVSHDHFAGHKVQSDLVRFVSVMSRRPRLATAPPMRFPATGPWLLRILAVDRRFVIGVYRREMTSLKYLGALDDLFGVPVTTRNWNTVDAIARVLGGE